jgi:hypothetical protein
MASNRGWGRAPSIPGGMEWWATMSESELILAAGALMACALAAFLAPARLGSNASCCSFPSGWAIGPDGARWIEFGN